MNHIHRLPGAIACIIAFCLAFPAAQAQGLPAVRILPLGDSITGGCCSDQLSGSYRKRLHLLLTGAGYNADFVGTLNDTPDPPDFTDTDHQGEDGYRIEHIDASVGIWLKKINDPDVILIHAGTNNFWVGADLDDVETRLVKLLDTVCGLRPHAKVIVASLILRDDSYEEIQAEFAAQLPRIVSEQTAMGRNVTFLDLHQSLDPGYLMPDNVHPRGKC
jgi:lysophospholipase L1-like esterase